MTDSLKPLINEIFNLGGPLAASNTIQLSDLPVSAPNVRESWATMLQLKGRIAVLEDSIVHLEADIMARLVDGVL